VKANETKFQDLVAVNHQYFVPLFQRPYSWTKREWKTLWDDIVELMENSAEHFIGSIVNIPTPSIPAGVSKFLLIDGQQRMTTLFVVMAALRDKANAHGNAPLADEINDMIVNRHRKGDDHYKLMPTQIDREAFKRVISENDSQSNAMIAQCYRYFSQRISADNMQAVFDVIGSKLSMTTHMWCLRA
jgi:uncharacterized protein with ParB-like and HNH nuclease domain